MASTDDVMLMLGEIKATVQGTKEEVGNLRDDVRIDNEAAQKSRTAMHARLDSQSEQISHLETTVAISGEVDAQLRDRLIALEHTVSKNHDAVQPHIEDMKRMKTLGWGISGLIAIAGLTVGSIVVYASDAAKAAVKHWLN